jgi:hypothetical protein
MPPAVLLLAYNWASFGGPFSIGYVHLANSGFAAGQSQGILGATWPRPGAVGDILFGPRGLLRYSPWLALTPAGIWAARRRGLRWEIGICTALVGAYILVNGGYYLPYGGATPGPRFLMPMLPFAAVLVALAPRLIRSLAAALVVPSIALTALATATMPNAIEGVADPLNDLWLPMLRGSLLAENTGWLRWGLHGLVPLAALGLVAVSAGLAVWTTTRADRTVRRVGLGAGIVLGLLFASLGTPIDVPSAVGLTALVHRLGTDANGVGLTIVDTGVAGILKSEQRTSVRPWAQIEGHDGGAPDTRVVFTIVDSRGKSVFAVLYDHLAWGSHQR